MGKNHKALKFGSAGGTSGSDKTEMRPHEVVSEGY